jgi:hypothetical protein
MATSNVHIKQHSLMQLLHAAHEFNSKDVQQPLSQEYRAADTAGKAAASPN